MDYSFYYCVCMCVFPDCLCDVASYSSLCMVLYEPIRHALVSSSFYPRTSTSSSPESSESPATFGEKLMAGGCSGALSVSLVNPLEVIKLRMQADRTGRLYHGVGDAIRKITTTEGLAGFSRVSRVEVDSNDAWRLT